jgi:signal transduction histidine kinase
VVVDSLREPGTTLSIQVVPFGIEERLLISRNITQLEAVARMRRDFIANVSHELKTPLTVVSGFIETLQDLELEPRQRTRYLQLMAEQAKNMQRLVDDLLTLSTLESDQNPLAEAQFDVVPLLLQVSADAKALSAGRHAVALDIADHAIVIGSRDELGSAFGNLVSNAIRYTPEGGAITLAWRVDEEGHGVFGVTDTGIGIAPEHIPAVDRTVLSRRSQPLARNGRNGTRPRDRQARTAAPPGRARRDERVGQRYDVHSASASASRSPFACEPCRGERGGVAARTRFATRIGSGKARRRDAVGSGYQ